jgi:glycosyltransferase involved in cell wall biosynthesis
MSLEIIVMCDNDDACFRAASQYAGAGVAVGNLAAHGGTYVAQNTAISESSGEYITFCGADDIMGPRRIARLFAVMRRHGPMALANSYHQRIAANGAWLKDDLGSLGGIFMYHRSVFAKLGGFRDWECAADTEFINRAESLGCFIHVYPKHDYRYRLHGDQLTESSSTGSCSQARAQYLELIKTSRLDGHIDAQTGRLAGPMLRGRPLQFLEEGVLVREAPNDRVDVDPR